MVGGSSRMDENQVIMEMYRKTAELKVGRYSTPWHRGQGGLVPWPLLH